MLVLSCTSSYVDLSQNKTCITVNVLKFRTLVGFKNGLDKQSRPGSDCFFRSSLIWVFHNCYSDMHFVNSSPDNQHFMKRKRKVFDFFRTFTVYFYIRAEIESLSQETEAQEIQIRSTNDKLVEEANTKKKLERILSDAAGALRVALRVSVNLILMHWIL